MGEAILSMEVYGAKVGSLSTIGLKLAVIK